MALRRRPRLARRSAAQRGARPVPFRRSWLARLRAHAAPLPADLARVDLRHVPDAGDVPAAMGVGLGAFVDRADRAPWAGCRYLAFLAPGPAGLDRRCRPARSRRRSRSSAASAGPAATTRCMRTPLTPDAHRARADRLDRDPDDAGRRDLLPRDGPVRGGLVAVGRAGDPRRRRWPACASRARSAPS